MNINGTITRVPCDFYDFQFNIETDSDQAAINATAAAQFAIACGCGGAKIPAGTICRLPDGVLVVEDDALPGDDGLSWDTAYQTLTEALSEAGLTATDDAPAEIWVTSRTYKPTDTTDRSIRFEPVNNVAVHGGFLGPETTLAQRTVGQVEVGGGIHNRTRAPSSRMSLSAVV